MQATELTFGVEFEIVVPVACRIQSGSYHHGLQVEGLPRGWNAQSDCSINAPRGYRGVEIVSPVLQGADGVLQILAVCEWFARIGAKVNGSTGFHVHVGWAGNEEQLKRLVFLVAHHEIALFASTGSHSRETGAFCRSIQNDRGHQRRYLDGAPQYGDASGRYHVLNLTNLARENGKRTVEFRVFAGTTNATKALAHIRTCLALVEKAFVAKRRPQWQTAKAPSAKNSVKRSGIGQTELARLFYAIGWTRGREDRAFGDFACDGAPTIAQLKRELMRLAKKYDGGIESQE